MAYCSKCGAKLAGEAAFCSGCGDAVLASAKSKSAQSSSLAAPAQSDSDSLAQSASNSITRKLGLEMIQGFSLADFFSEVFRKHDPREVERLLTVGSPETTPPLSAAMGILPNPWIFFRVLCGTIIVYFIFVYAWNTFQNLNLVPGLIIETVMSPRFLKLFAVPVALHFIWNFNLPFQMNLFVKAGILGFFAWVVILSLVQSGLREMAELTAPKESDGVITETRGAS